MTVIFVANFIRLPQRQNVESRLGVDKVTDSLNVGTFLRYSVYLKVIANCLCQCPVASLFQVTVYKQHNSPFTNWFQGSRHSRNRHLGPATFTTGSSNLPTGSRWSSIGTLCDITSLRHLRSAADEPCHSHRHMCRSNTDS